MPVLRKRETVRAAGGGGGIVQARGNAMSTVLDQSSSMLAKHAASYAQSMAAASEDEAKALAKAAVFSMGPNGLPQMPADITHRMGELAARTYDASMEDRFAFQMTTAIKKEISEAQNANLYDIDAFTAEAEERISQLGLDVPDGYEGMFQQISTGLMVDAGASVGARQGALAINSARGQVVEIAKDTGENLYNEIMGTGWTEATEAKYNTAVEMIRAYPDAVADPARKQALIDALNLDIAKARIVRDLKITDPDTTPSQINSVIERLNSGEDPELNKYFKDTADPDSAPDRATMEGVAGFLSKFLAEAHRRQQEWETQRKAKQAFDDVRNGMAKASDNNGTNPKILDAVIAPLLGGEVVKPEDWLAISPQDRAAAIAQIKTSGFMPESMEKLFRSLDRQNEFRSDEQSQGWVEQMRVAYGLYRDLKDSGNRSFNAGGETKPVWAELPEGVLRAFQAVDDMGGDGEIGTQTFANALLNYKSTLNMEWNDEIFAKQLNKSNPMLNGTWTTSNLESGVAKLMRDEEVSGEDPTAKDVEIASRVFQWQIRAGHTYDEALSITKQSMAGRSVETKFMLGADRSGNAPEKYYSFSGEGTFSEFIDALVQGGKSRSAGAAESIANVWRALGITMLPEADFGSAMLGATPFEAIAHGKIYDYIVKHKLEDEHASERVGWGAGFLQGGKDYKLIAKKGAGTPPVYHVQMRNSKTGIWEPLQDPTGDPFVLDVRKEIQDLKKVTQSMKTMEEIALKKAKDQAMDVDVALKRASEGLSSDYKTMLKEFYELELKKIAASYGPRLRK